MPLFGFLATFLLMEGAIQDTKQKIAIIQKLVDTCKDQRQKAMYLHCLYNAKQVLANFQEMDRILKTGL